MPQIPLAENFQVAEIVETVLKVRNFYFISMFAVLQNIQCRVINPLYCKHTYTYVQKKLKILADDVTPKEKKD